MKTAILTYDHPHRKTQELLMRMKAYGFNDVTVVATPWEDRKGHVPLFPHRFLKALDIPLQEFVVNLGYYMARPLNLGEYLKQFDYVLIGGAGILSEDVVRSTTIINSHPGYLPNTRGLDALKWAIYEEDTIGVTSYVIDVEADTGCLIERQGCFPEPMDSFESFAMKHFDLEINMLVRAIDIYKDCSRDKESIWEHLNPIGEDHKRMKHWEELIMLKRFEELKMVGV